jgi:hypothetical protein
MMVAGYGSVEGRRKIAMRTLLEMAQTHDSFQRTAQTKSILLHWLSTGPICTKAFNLQAGGHTPFQPLVDTFLMTSRRVPDK